MHQLPRGGSAFYTSNTAATWRKRRGSADPAGPRLHAEAVHEDMIWLVDARTPRSCASQDCRDKSCDGQHVPVSVLLAGRLIARVAPPGTLEYAIFEIGVRGLAFPFASGRAVYFDTSKGLFLLIRRFGRRVFLGSKVNHVRFFDKYFAGIGTLSASELAQRYDATCAPSDAPGVSAAQMKDWGLQHQPETETWLWRPQKQTAPAPHTSSDLVCRRAGGLLVGAVEKTTFETDRGTWMWKGPSSNPWAPAFEDGPPGVVRLREGASQDEIDSWMLQEAEKELAWAWLPHAETEIPIQFAPFDTSARESSKPPREKATMQSQIVRDDKRQLKKLDATDLITNRVNAHMNGDRPYLRRARDLRKAKRVRTSHQ